MIFGIQSLSHSKNSLINGVGLKQVSITSTTLVHGIENYGHWKIMGDALKCVFKPFEYILFTLK